MKPGSIHAKYPTTIGFERTMIPAGIGPYDSENAADRALDRIHGRTRKTPSMVVPGYGKNEHGAIEYCSVPCRNPREIERFWKQTDVLYARSPIPLAPSTVYQSPNGPVHVEGGGGHIHVGIHDPMVGLNMMRYLLNRPFIQWMMADWCDDDTLACAVYNGIHAFGGADIRNVSDEIHDVLSTGIHLPWGCGPAQLRTHPSAHKPGHVHGTVELRMFQAPVDLQHLHDNIDLALAIYTHCDTSYRIHHLTHDNSEDYCTDWQKIIDEDEVENYFMVWIQNVGLSPDRYCRYIENYQTRRDNGMLLSKTFISDLS